MGLTFSKKNKVFELPRPLAPLYDTHAHLRSFWGDDKRIPAVLARAAAAGVASIVTIYDPVADLSDETPDAAAYSAWLAGELDRARAELAANPGLTTGPRLISAPSLTYLVGVHPYGAPDYSDAIHAQVEAALADPLCVGVGEIGLDYHFDAVDDILVGVHPYGAPDYSDAIHAQVEAALADPLCVGVGEIGLDYHFDAVDDIEAAPHDLQMEVMSRQLELAVERDVPVELHIRNDNGDESREAHADALRVLERVGAPRAGCVLHCFGEDERDVPVELHIRNDNGDESREAHADALRVLERVGAPRAGCVLHCFGEDADTMMRFVEFGCHIAFGGAATFKRNDAVREAFATCPLDRLLLETDCPYMAPEPIRGLECEPAMIAQTADVLAYDRADRTGELPVDIARALHANARALFG